jgi:4-amino-4-deoxyprephenate dehydrogenase
LENEALRFESTIIIGAGAVGGLCARQLARHSRRMRLYDSNGGSSAHTSDVLRPTFGLTTDLSSAELVVLALPERVLLQALPVVSRLAAPTALIVETGSIKTPLLKAVAECAPGPGIVGINPLFGPSLDFAGQNVALTMFRGGGRATTFAACIRSWRANLTELSPEEHDRFTAFTQVAIHCALLASGALASSAQDPQALLRVATPPFRAILCLLGRMLRQNPEVYWDIQANNPFAAEARAALQREVAALDGLIKHGNSADFAARLAQLTTALDGVVPASLAESDAMLAALRTAGDQPST